MCTIINAFFTYSNRIITPKVKGSAKLFAPTFPNLPVRSLSLSQHIYTNYPSKKPVVMAMASLYRRSLPSPPAIDFSSSEGKVRDQVFDSSIFFLKLKLGYF